MKMNNTQIEAKIEQILEKYNYFLIEFVIRGNNNNRIFEVFVDNETGVETDTCAKISSEISSFLDDEEIVSKYRLDVSSPGLGRPLKFIQQFPKHLNRKFKVSYFDADKKKKFSGKLIKVLENELVFAVSGKEVIIDFKNIIKAKVEISF